MSLQKYDFVILGAGISGLAIARSLLQKQLQSKVIILDKEPLPAKHGSGRNSGVLHSGIYYPEGSLKAQMCAEGARLMWEYCEQNQLPLDRMGKVIVPTKDSEDHLVDLLNTRGQANGATVSIIDAQQLKEIEPEARTATGRALHSPNTAVVDPKVIVTHMLSELSDRGADIHFSEYVDRVDVGSSTIFTNKGSYSYGTLFNATGQQADKVARLFGASKDYTLLPFKGIYYALSHNCNLKFNGLIYPVPDLNVPFLGVHSVKTIDGSVYFGPTAIPALGRENYSGLKSIELGDVCSISYHLLQQYARNKQGFRQFSHDEAGRFIKSKFAEAARALVPNLQNEHLVTSSKVGIRAQLVNTAKHELVMDFLVEEKGNTIHVLNAISPAFTSSLSFANKITQKFS